MSESKDVAKRICDQMFKTNPSMNFLESDIIDIADAIDALNITFAPPVPEGSVKVRIAVVRGIGDDERILIYTKDADDGLPHDNYCPDDTHRGIVEAWIPKVTPAPTVSGRVVSG